MSITTVEMPLADILASEHSINYHESADNMGLYIACGDIGGPIMDGADVAIGLADQNGTGHSGVAWLHDNGDDTTTVYVFLMEGYPAPATTTTAASPAPAMSSAAPEASPMASMPQRSKARPRPPVSRRQSGRQHRAASESRSQHRAADGEPGAGGGKPGARDEPSAGREPGRLTDESRRPTSAGPHGRPDRPCGRLCLSAE